MPDSHFNLNITLPLLDAACGSFPVDSTAIYHPVCQKQQRLETRAVSACLSADVLSDTRSLDYLRTALLSLWILLPLEEPANSGRHACSTIPKSRFPVSRTV